MAILNSIAKATLEDFERLPEGSPSYEFEDGEIITMPSPSPEHQDIVGELSHAARRFVREHSLSRVFMEVDVYLPDGRVYVPDICFVSAARLHLLNPVDRKIHGAPDLCVEVISQDEARDRVTKFRVYYDNGVFWYWLIDPDTFAIEEYRLMPEGYMRTASISRGERFHPGAFPGLTIDLAALLGISTPPTNP